MDEHLQKTPENPGNLWLIYMEGIQHVKDLNCG